MTWLVLFPSGFYYVKKCERLHTELLITIKNIKRFFWHTKTQKKIREHLSPFLVWCMNFKRIFQIKTETSCFLRLYKNCEPLWQNSLFTKGWNHVRRSILFMNAKIKTIKKTPSVCHRIVQLQYIFLLFFYAFSCVHDCIFLSNSVGHDSLSSRLIWSVRVWLCTQFGGLMSSLGSRKPSFFFFDEENQNELTSILIQQSYLFVIWSERLRDISSTYQCLLFLWKLSCIDM